MIPRHYRERLVTLGRRSPEPGIVRPAPVPVQKRDVSHYAAITHFEETRPAVLEELDALAQLADLTTYSDDPAWAAGLLFGGGR